LPLQTRASLPLDAAAGRAITLTRKLEAALKCRSCKKGRYAPPVHMTKLTQEREAKPSRLNPVSARLRELDGGDRPLTIVSSDRDSQTVRFIEPNVLHRPGFAIGEDYGLADKFSLRLLEHVEDRGHSEVYRGHG
jgi:hypothetical protein